ncbi:MAG TPA: RES family NAD+ phosphorylase [Bacteroidia bacterium]|jgi:RES domain-containing protein|nr:RES family NAD+ phosphorylase [Bacteroidia bacterium]
MIVFRIAKRTHAADITGTGAALYPGRWNKKGTPVLYTGETKEIALLETVVHTPPMMVPDLDVLTIEIPGDSVTELSIHDLPPNWFQYPAPTVLSEIGQRWVLENKTVALKVPSCIIHTSHNFILNCKHKDYRKVIVLEHGGFYFDPRLTKLQQVS